MKNEGCATQNSLALNATLGMVALVGGSYSLYKLMQKYPSDQGWGDNKFRAIVGPPERGSVLNSMARTIPISAVASIMCAGAWKIVSGEYIMHSVKGLAALTAVYTFPTAGVIFGNLDSLRLYDEAITVTKAVATAISTATAVSLVASGQAQSSNLGVAAFSATATFPAALTFFNYKTRDGAEEDHSVVAKAVSTSVAVAGAISLVAYLRPTNRA